MSQANREFVAAYNLPRREAVRYLKGSFQNESSIREEKIGVRSTLAICGAITVLAALFAFQRYRNKVEVPKDFSVDVVLPPPYENKS